MSNILKNLSANANTLPFSVIVSFVLSLNCGESSGLYFLSTERCNICSIALSEMCINCPLLGDNHRNMHAITW